MLHSRAGRCHTPACKPLLGDSTLSDFTLPDTYFGIKDYVYAFGVFTSPPVLPRQANYMFVFSVPDQSGYGSSNTNNQFRFALYTNDSAGQLTLALQSEVASLDMTARGPQSIQANVDALSAAALLPNTDYSIGQRSLAHCPPAATACVSHKLRAQR